MERTSTTRNIIQLNTNQYEFLRLMAFGSEQDDLTAASEKAYGDLRRTIRFKNLDVEERRFLRTHIRNLIAGSLTLLESTRSLSQEDFDKWHRELCFSILAEYRNAGIEFYVGQSQKWVNMALKYLYTLRNPIAMMVFPHLHVPIDNYIYEAAEKHLNIPRLAVVWSRVEDYSVYIQYQSQIRNALHVAPMEWEFSAWMQKAQEKKS